MVIRNVKNAGRFVAAVKKQNENIDRNYPLLNKTHVYNGRCE